MKLWRKIKAVKNAIMLPVGIDEDFDEECNKSFLRFLATVYSIFFAAYVLSAIIVLYFFVQHEFF